jgi:sulfite reductase (NADPH) hemoprotein beta-component
MTTANETSELSAVEKTKAASRLLRGTIAEGLLEGSTGALVEGDTQLLKFHGSYQQDDRDLREERRLQKLEPAYSFMIRTRLPGGVCTPKQWLALDAISRQYANGTLRLTTRQAFQFHGVIKRELKATMAAINATLIDTIAACGDVNRNVLASANPVESQLHAAIFEWSKRLSEHLLPQTRAYHEIWLDGRKIDQAGIEGPAEIEPIYGPTYLPRKFKVAFVVPPSNDVDVFAHDLGFIAILEPHSASNESGSNKLVGFNVTIGGGLGASHGEAATYPRLADVIGFVTPDQLLRVAEAVVTTQRDLGDRTNRKHARLKYTIDTHGLDKVVAQIVSRFGAPLQPARPFEFSGVGDRFGWTQGYDGREHLTLRIPSGRVADTPGAPWLTGLREIAKVHQGDFRLTPNQNLIIAGIAKDQRAAIAALVSQYALNLHERATPVRLDSLACVAMPTCPLAMAEAERYLPALVDRIEERLAKHGLRDAPLLLRITGCPNGCARPYLAEIGLIGKALGRYNLHLGGDSNGRRLNTLAFENLDETSILDTLDPLFAAYAAERSQGERFGDFLWRSQRLRPLSSRANAQGVS